MGPTEGHLPVAACVCDSDCGINHPSRTLLRVKGTDHSIEESSKCL